jgi:type IV pilus assembly protein PilW
MDWMSKKVIRNESRFTLHGSRFTVHERGMTLIELMFGLALATLAIGASYTAMSSSQKAASINNQTAEMQQNARVAMELLTQDLKTAGFGMLGTPVGVCTNPIMPADQTSGGADTGPDSVSVVAPMLLSTLSVQANPAATTITLQAGVTYPTGFGVGSIVTINGVISRSVTAVNTNTLNFGTGIGVSAVFPIGTPVYWLQCIRYDVVRATDANAATLCGGTPPCLRRGPNPDTNPTGMVAVAEGIEDLQLAYACDGCNAALAMGSVPDGIIDDWNASNTFDTADFVSNKTWAAAPETPDKIRMVRISIVAIQRQADEKWASTAPITAEDHNPTQDAGYSQAAYAQSRRRLLTRTVQVKNLGS